MPDRRTESNRTPTAVDGTGSGEMSLAGARRQRLALRSHPNLKDKAAAHLRDEILSGRMRPGQKVDQEEIADTLGMSRLPVREALIELTQESLVESLPRRGSFVAQITEEDILDQYRVQGMIAGLGARRAATRLSDDELDRLRSFHDEFERSDDRQEQADLSFAFHAVILEAGASNRLFSILRLLLRSLPTDYFEVTPHEKQRMVTHRSDLLAALERRDGETAAEIQERLWIELGETTVQTLRSAGLWSRTDD